MIYLISKNTNGIVFDITQEKEYIVGRKLCDILISDDQSISRKHAVITVKGDDAYLQDCGSKYKTFHNNTELQPNKKIMLKNKDNITFGALRSNFIFEKVKWATTSSGFTSAKKEALKKELSMCDVRYFDQWGSYCTHLTVEVITLTIKVLQAIVDEKPIVISNYWKDLNKALKSESALPDVENYRPPLAETLLNKFDFSPNPKRKVLFKGKIFVFLTEEGREQCKAVIQSCGGESVSWEKSVISLHDLRSTSPEYVIMQFEDDEINKDASLKTIVKEIHNQGKRTIPVQEIGLAILLGSCERDCNPNFNRVKQVFLNETRAHPTQTNALVQETQSQELNPGVAKKANLIVAQSVDDGCLEDPNQNEENIDLNKDPLKRLQKEQTSLNPKKKIKIEDNGDGQDKITTRDVFIEKNSASSISKKRKADENVEIVEPGPKKSYNVNPFAMLKPSTSNSSNKPNDNPFMKQKNPEGTQNSTQVSNKNPRKNPFAFLSMRKEDNANISSVPPDNPFRNLRKAVSTQDSKQNKEERIFHSTLLGDPSRENISTLSKTVKLSNHNLTWLSKEFAKNSTIKKEEVDPEYEKVVELFQNCVKIEIMDISKPNILSVANCSTVSNGKKNFKKFKKVNPVNPQCRIIGKNQLIKFAPGGAECIERTGLSDDETSKSINKAPQRKTFAF